MNPALSIFLPVFNEEENLERLHTSLLGTLSKLGKSFEIIYVDDGSSDRSLAILSDFAQQDARVRVIAFRRNYGQTAAMSAGIDGTTASAVPWSCVCAKS